MDKSCLLICLAFCASSLAQVVQPQSLSHPRFSSGPRQRLPFDLVSGRQQQRPARPQPPPSAQQQRPFQLEGGFTPLTSLDSVAAAATTLGGTVAKGQLLRQESPSVANSVDLTVQSLTQHRQLQRHRLNGNEALSPQSVFHRPQVASPPHTFHQGGRGPPGNPTVVGHEGPRRPPQGDARRPGFAIEGVVAPDTTGHLLRQWPQLPFRTFTVPPVDLRHHALLSPALQFGQRHQSTSTGGLTRGHDATFPFPFQQVTSELTNDLDHVRNRGILTQNTQQVPPSGFLHAAPHHGNSVSSTSAPALTRRATLKEILNEDCKDFVDFGFCESPQRYPTAQVVVLMSKCSKVLDSLYVPVPESNIISSPASHTSTKGKTPLTHVERANHGIWSWAKYANEKGSVCSSDIRQVTPSYARDITGRWVVVLQHEEGNMNQRVPVDMCKGVQQPCLSGPEGYHRPDTKCIQRHTHHHLVTWDPDNPDECPALRVFSFPTACLCHFSSSA